MIAMPRFADVAADAFDDATNAADELPLLSLMPPARRCQMLAPASRYATTLSCRRQESYADDREAAFATYATLILVACRRRHCRRQPPLPLLLIQIRYIADIS